MVNADLSDMTLTEKVGGGQQKPKRRPYLLKKKALSTGFFESGSKREDSKGENEIYGNPFFVV